MEDELNKLKVQNWNFMSMVKDYDFRREKDREWFMQELEERQPDAVFRGAKRSTPNVVMNFTTKVYKKQAEKEVLRAGTGPDRCQWGGTDDPACARARISDHEVLTTTPIDHE